MTDHEFEQDESMAWELTAAAVHHPEAQGCYRGPSGPDGPTTFLAITSIRTVQTNGPAPNHGQPHAQQSSE